MKVLIVLGIVVVLIGFAFCFALCFCRAAASGDRLAEKHWEEKR